MSFSIVNSNSTMGHLTSIAAYITLIVLEYAALNCGATPSECLNAVNLDEIWRADRIGSDWRPGGPHANFWGFACDFHKDLQWFRFSGRAGVF